MIASHPCLKAAAGFEESSYRYGFSRNKNGEFRIDVFDTRQPFERNLTNKSFSYFKTGGIDHVVSK